MLKDNDQILSDLEKLLKSKKSKKFYARRLNITVDKVNNLISQLKGKSQKETVKKVNVDKGTLESTIETTFDPKTIDELAKLHKIDLTRYKISNYWSKLKANGKFTSSVFATLIKDEITPEDILRVLSTYKSPVKSITKRENLNKSKFQDRTCAFIDITDFHLDKWDIYNTSIETKVSQYHQLLDSLLHKAASTNYLEEIAFVIGSDMLHTDNFANQTTKGTQQEVSIRWNEAFDIAFDLYATCINKMRHIASTIKVILVAGNHGRTKEYYLAFALSKYFEGDKNIQFDISPAPRKVYTYGNTFIGLHHGNTKIDTLPIVFAKEFTEQWGKAKYHEIKVGDKHHYMEKDYAGVRIKQLPACSNPDTWHNDNNFITNQQGVICSIYNRTKGRCMDIEERL